MDTSNPVVQAYIVSAVILGMNLLVLANNTALTRTFANEVVNPEDKVLNREAAIVFEAGNDHTERYRRAHRNALENVPLFLITGFILTWTAVPFWLAATVFGIFVVARVMHSICYRYGLQPFRTASFAIGALDQVAILGLLAYYTFVG